MSATKQGILLEERTRFISEDGQGLDLSRIMPLKRLRKKIDNYTCQICFTEEGPFEVDHIKRVRDYLEFAYDLGNMRTLCVPRHKNTSTYGGRKAKEDTRVSEVGSAKELI